MASVLNTAIEGNGGIMASLKWFSYTMTNVANGGGETVIPDCNEVLSAYWSGAAGITSITWVGATITIISTAGTEDGVLFVIAR